MSRLLKFTLPIAFLAMGGVAVKALGSRDRSPQKNLQTERTIAVQTTTITRRQATFFVSAEGTVKAVQNTSLSAQVAGRVVRVSDKLKTGGRFLKGETLLQIDARDYRARLVQAQAQVQRAQMEFQMTQQRRSVAQAEYAGSGVGDAKEAHPLAQYEPQLRVAAATLSSAQAGEQLAQLAVNRTTLRAPYDCVVRQRQVEVGDTVGPGRMLVAVAGTATYEVTLSVGEDKLALIQRGGATSDRDVWVETDRSGTQRWRARIDRLEAELEPLGRLARLVVRIDDPLADGKNLFLGSFVRVKIEGAPFEDVFVVPDRAFNNGRVFVVDAEDRLASRTLEIVHRTPGFAYVKTGLSDGDELVISRMRNPLAGTKITRSEIGRTQASDRAQAASGQ